jgi:hypothetical protein
MACGVLPAATTPYLAGQAATQGGLAAQRQPTLAPGKHLQLRIELTEVRAERLVQAL